MDSNRRDKRKVSEEFVVDLRRPSFPRYSTVKSLQTQNHTYVIIYYKGCASAFFMVNMGLLVATLTSFANVLVRRMQDIVNQDAKILQR